MKKYQVPTIKYHCIGIFFEPSLAYKCTGFNFLYKTHSKSPTPSQVLYVSIKVPYIIKCLIFYIKIHVVEVFNSAVSVRLVKNWQLQ